MVEVLKKFGPYFLLDYIAEGGMAEIYRARLKSLDGQAKLFIIKKIQSNYRSNTEFLQMFKSEIKVTLGFNHPNIVQIYDFGENHNQPYIAMEWVDGKNLRQFLSRSQELKQTFPIEIAIYIGEQVASGLHYAHSFRDQLTGHSLNIVHRDISPQNILISFEGGIKIIDFGIAKTTMNYELTRAGVIKGKPSYLSPEQISGKNLDAKSDIFALGAVLWEMLTGEKLFAGENDLATLKLIENCSTHVKPPSTFNQKVPKALDEIVLQSLAKKPENRYSDAQALQRDLHKVLYRYYSEFNPSDLSTHAKNLFKAEIIEDRKWIQKSNQKAEKLLSQGSLENAEFKEKPQEIKMPIAGTVTLTQTRQNPTQTLTLTRLWFQKIFILLKKLELQTFIIISFIFLSVYIFKLQQNSFLPQSTVHPKEDYGFLTLHTVPNPGTIFSIDGRDFLLPLPIENKKIPVGNHQIRLTNPIFNMEKTAQLTIQKGKSLILKLDLEIKDLVKKEYHPL